MARLTSLSIVALLLPLAAIMWAAQDSALLVPKNQASTAEEQTGTKQADQAGPPASAPVFKASARAVLIDVVITDKKKQLVRGLTKDDFVLMEDGQAQTIASFVPTDATVSDGATAVPETTLLIDEMNTRFDDLAYARYSIRKLLDRSSHSLFQPTALLALTDDGLVVLQSYTRDTQLLKEALQRHHPAVAWRLNQGNGSAGERFNLSLRALAQIAIANRGSGARNTVVWISPGFPVLSKEQMSRQNRMALYEASRRLSDQLLRARIAVYTVDPRGANAGQPAFGDARSTGSPLMNSFGLTAQAPAPGGPQQSTEAVVQSQEASAAFVQSQRTVFGDLALQALASETGGRSLFGYNDVDDEVDASIAEGNTYYTLSYYPSNRAFDGKFRKIEVKLSKPGLEARTREGYYAFPDSDPSAEQIAYRLSDLLISPLSFASIPVREVSFVPSSSGPHAQLLLEIDGSALEWSELLNGDLQSTVDLAAADFLGNGKLIRAMFQPSSLTVPAAQVDGGKNPVRVSLRVALDNSARRVRVLVRDRATDRVGSIDITGALPINHAAIGRSQKKN